MGRNAFASPLELSLVEEPQSWRQKGKNCRSLMNSRSEGSGYAWLVVVFQEAGQFVLIGWVRPEMFADRPGFPVAKAIIESFVVSVIESLLLQGPFEIPIDLGHEAEVRNALPHLPGRLRPERLSVDSPGSLKNVRQNQHGHVASQSVTLPGNPYQLADHRFLRGRVTIVELKGVRPARKVRVAPVGEQKIALLSSDRGVVPGRPGQIQFGSTDV